MLFSYVQSIHVRVSTGQIDAYTFTPEAVLFISFEAAVLYIVILYFIRIWQKSGVFSIKEMVKIFGSSLVLFLILMKLSGLLLALGFGTVKQNFNQQTFFHSLFTDFLNGFIYGSFFLAYYYYNKSKTHQQQLVNYHQALTESKIHQLKSQLNPHFLFNNLNVLDQLIEEDKHKASDFLNEFADIYRYVLQTSDKKIVGLNEELSFAEQYFRLIQHKYGNAYQMNIERTNNSGYIVPLTLQLLIENAVQHNLGSEENPVFITIKVKENIHASNNINLKRNVKSSNGRALKNIKEQYKLLTDSPIEIQQSDNVFSVTIPIIYPQEV